MPPLEPHERPPNKWVPILVVVGVIVYVAIAGSTRSCPTCTVITDTLGIPPMGTAIPEK